MGDQEELRSPKLTDNLLKKDTMDVDDKNFENPLANVSKGGGGVEFIEDSSMNPSTEISEHILTREELEKALGTDLQHGLSNQVMNKTETCLFIFPVIDCIVCRVDSIVSMYIKTVCLITILLQGNEN